MDSKQPPYNPDAPMYPPVPPAAQYDQQYPPAQPGYNQPPPGYNQAPPPGYSPGPQQAGAAFTPAGGQQTTVIVQGQMRFGEAPVSMNCPKCRASIITATSYESGTGAWVGCLVCCGIGLLFAGITWLGCCLIPFCVNACKDVEHHCPNCRQVVGRYNRI